MSTPSSRAQIWAAIRKLGKAGADLTPTRIRGELAGPDARALERIRDYLKVLSAARIVEPAGPDQPGVWRLLRDEGVEAPRVLADGTRVTMGQGREALWRTMRILNQPWTVRELAIHASTETHPVALLEASDYTLRLAKAGYLHRAGRGQYRLIPSRYTGPQPPQIARTKVVWDPNLGRAPNWPLRPTGGAQ